MTYSWVILDICLFNKYVSGPCSAAGTVLGGGHVEMSKANMALAITGLTTCWRDQARQSTCNNDKRSPRCKTRMRGALHVGSEILGKTSLWKSQLSWNRPDEGKHRLKWRGRDRRMFQAEGPSRNKEDLGECFLKTGVQCELQVEGRI